MKLDNYRITPGKITKIDISNSEIEYRKKLFADALIPESAERTPVFVQCADLSFTDIYQITIDEYQNNFRLHAEAQIAGQKWILENMNTDYNGVYVDCRFGAVEHPSGFGCEILPQRNSRPWIHPWIKDSGDLEKLRKLDIASTGLYGLHHEWWEKYMKIAEEYPVQYKEGDVFYPLKSCLLPYAGSMDDALTQAINIMGSEQVFLGMMINPEFIKELCQIITDKSIELMLTSRKTCNYSGPQFVSSDFSPMIHPDQYREFALPYLKQIKEALDGPMQLHNCMVPREIIDIVLTDLKPSINNGFKANNNVTEEMKIMAEKAGGKIFLEPYLDGTKMLVQTEDEIYKDAFDAIKLFAPTGKFFLGAWACEGMPLNEMYKLNVIKQASIDFSKLK